MNNRNPVKAETPRSVKVIEVIETISLRGDGVKSPCRQVTQYWSKEGRLLGENDPAPDGIAYGDREPEPAEEG